MLNWIIDSASVLSLREWIAAGVAMALVCAWVWLMSNDGFPPMDP